MDYINSNFVALKDLDDIDARINELSERKLQIAAAIKQKTNDNSKQDDLSNTAVEGLIRAIREIPANSPLAETIDNIMKENGQISVLQELKHDIHTKRALETRNIALKEAAKIEQELEETEKSKDSSDTDLLTRITASIESIEDVSIKDVLQERLEGIVNKSKEQLSEKLQTVLTEIHWLSPKERVLIPAPQLKLITSVFTELVDLQAAYRAPEYPNVWWALEILLHPFVMRFNYHFSRVNETNKMARPEWALAFVEKFFSEQMAPVELVMGRSFIKHNRIGGCEAMTAALVPVREKLIRMVQVLNDNIQRCQNDEDPTSLERNGRLLLHLIFETTSFDQRLRNTYKYNPYIEDYRVAPQKKWMGLTGDILLAELGESLAANNWLNLELRLAKKQFNTEILSTANAFDIDYEFDAGLTVRPSYSAFAMVKLFDNLTTHFKNLSIVKFQLKYVSNIQLVLLDEYLEALQKTFRLFDELLSLKLMANLRGKQDGAQVIVANGLKALETLTGLYCLLKFVCQRMEEWSEDLVYIQLWNSYKSYAATKVTDDSIFSSALRQYNQLLQRAFTKYDEFFRKEVRNSLKEYANLAAWMVHEPRGHQPSPVLSNFITILPAYMLYLKRALPEVDYYLVASKVCDSFGAVLQEYVITNNQFNSRGIEQLKIDFDCLVGYLEDGLLLDSDAKYSNCDNRSFNKVVQSLEVLSTFDAATAKQLRLHPSGDVRKEFESKLSCLTDNECTDLLYRIH